VNTTLLSGSQAILDTQSTNFTIAPSRNVPYPISSFKQARIDNTSYFYTSWEANIRTPATTPERRMFRTALTTIPISQVPASLAAYPEPDGKFMQVMAESGAVEGDPETRFDYISPCNALFGMKDYKNAQKELLRQQVFTTTTYGYSTSWDSLSPIRETLKKASKRWKPPNIDSKQERIQKSCRNEIQDPERTENSKKK
jgi:hypothetical protein